MKKSRFTTLEKAPELLLSALWPGRTGPYAEPVVRPAEPRDRILPSL